MTPDPDSDYHVWLEAYTRADVSVRCSSPGCRVPALAISCLPGYDAAPWEVSS